jgi:hypothetical protein
MTISDKKMPDKCQQFSCEKCDFLTSKKSNYNIHLATDKHKMMTNDDKKNAENDKSYLCECGKEYKYRQGLSLHKKKCSQNNTQIVEKKDDDLNYKEMFLVMVEQNKQLQKTLTEVIPRIGNTTNNTTNNNNNNSVNIVTNINFLNDNCKNALNINDFIESITVKLNDLEYTGKKGLAAGIANLFLENYSKLPLDMRPLWCGDKKRKKFYIKEDEWQEDKDSQKTKKAIKNLSVKQAKNTNMFAKEHPDWMANEKKKDAYIGIIGQTTANVDDKMEKIISNIADKSHLSDETKEELHTTE